MVSAIRRCARGLLFGVALSGGADAYVHPGLLHNAADLAFMRAKVEAMEQPWYGSWVELTNDYRCRPYYPWQAWEVVTSNAPYAGSLTSFRQDCYAVYVNALAYAISTNTVFADRALAILNGWTATLTNIDGNFNGANQGQLLTAWAVHPFVNGAELLRATLPAGYWSGADQDRFARFLTNFCAPQITQFAPDYHGNWGVTMMASVASMGIYLDDPALFALATNAFWNLNTGSFNLARFTNYIYPTGQCEESGRDQGHCHMGIGALLVLAETAWKQGVDLYGAHDNRLAKGVEYLARYNLGNDDLPQPWYLLPPAVTWTQVSAAERGNFVGIYELPYQRYQLDRGIPMPWTEQVIGLTNWTGTNGFARTINFVSGKNYRPEAGWSYGEGFGTLAYYRGQTSNTQGPVVSAPSPVSGLTVTEQAATRLQLAWAVTNTNGVSGFRLDRRTGQGAWSFWLALSRTNRGVVDTNLTPGIPVGYRVAATNAGGASAWTESATLMSTLRLEPVSNRANVDIPEGRVRLSGSFRGKNFTDPVGLAATLRRSDGKVVATLRLEPSALLQDGIGWGADWVLPKNVPTTDRMRLEFLFLLGTNTFSGTGLSNLDLRSLWPTRMDLTSGMILENPWRPDLSTVTFADLGPETTVTVRTLQGRTLLERVTPKGSLSGTLIWSPAASMPPGVYLVTLRAPGIAEKRLRWVVLP